MALQVCKTWSVDLCGCHDLEKKAAARGVILKRRLGTGKRVEFRPGSTEDIAYTRAGFNIIPPLLSVERFDVLRLYPMGPNQWDTERASLPRKRISGPICFVSVRADQKRDFKTVTCDHGVTVVPIVWPARENGIAWIRDVESRLARPHRFP